MECHCGKHGHALNSSNCPIHGDKLRASMQLIADIASGSTTANSLPNIARIARAALTNQ